MKDLFEPFEAHGITYSNRIALSALTRARASIDAVPGPLQAEYYRQRASAGLLITEAIAISAGARGGARTPGLYDQQHIDGWRSTTQAVHGEGGRIFAQLWHAGRQSHRSFGIDGDAPISPSAMAATGIAYTEAGSLPYDPPRALATNEIGAVVEQFRQAADNALQAGFDGVELHCGHGYLLDSFLRDAINDRTDRYGGTLENRARFVVEVVEAVVGCVGGARVSVRISPNTKAGGMHDSNPTETFGYLVDRLNELGVAWLDIVEGDDLVSRTPEGAMDTDKLARRFTGSIILNHAYTRDLAQIACAEGRADMIAFGRPFIANPDLVTRLRIGAPLADAPREIWYGGGAEGLTDFPRWDDKTAQG
jgi:N-ethylmaleimide reductase